jgi:hypothetical protein
MIISPPARDTGRSGGLLQPRPGAREESSGNPPSRELPAWPIMVLLAGFPVWWALGASPFMPMGLAVVMLVLMGLRGRTVTVPGLLGWGLFLLWVLASAISLRRTGSPIAYGQRVGELIAVGVFMLYIVNARHSLPRARIVKGLLVVWATVVGMGLLGMAFPDLRLSTPVGAILPGGLKTNELVADLVNPPLAEIQQPWGAPTPYLRPSAPFPYANSWGVAFVVLTPVVLYRLMQTRRTGLRLLLLGGLALSFLPALATSNRGMFIGLAVSVAYVVIRLAVRGQLLPAVAIVGSGAVAFAAFVASGALETILGRQEYSDSTGGRMALYEATIKETLKSPFLGHATPRMEETIGVSMGTQGYVWMLLFCYGFVGLGLFMAFLVGAILRTARVPDTASLWLHSVPVAMLAMIPFYSFAVVQLTCVAVILALLLRERYLPAEEWP